MLDITKARHGAGPPRYVSGLRLLLCARRSIKAGPGCSGDTKPPEFLTIVDPMSRRGKTKGVGSPFGRLSALRRASSSTVSDPTLGMPWKTLGIGAKRSGEVGRGLGKSGDKDRGWPAGLSGSGDTDLLELDGRNMELGCADLAVAGPRILVTGKACGITDSPLPICRIACPEPSQLMRSRTERELAGFGDGLTRALAATTTFSV
mmetsp:Transcript_37509/g.82066  ORF Transcript_37509/g.82066 Transcript_37509/m.82066 type:complete len:205 (-) Transcript_37509:659-1273(-)